MLYNNVPFWLHLAQRKNKTMTKTATQSSKSALTIKLCVHRHTQTHKLYVHVYMTITAPSNIFHCTQTKWIIELRLTTESNLIVCVSALSQLKQSWDCFFVLTAISDWNHLDYTAVNALSVEPLRHWFHPSSEPTSTAPHCCAMPYPGMKQCTIQIQMTEWVKVAW